MYFIPDGGVIESVGRQLFQNLCIQQGTGQGRTFSLACYKIYNNPLIKTLDKSNLGAHIGDISTVAPFCADDETLLTKHGSPDSQIVTTVTEDYANDNRYTIGVQKTSACIYTTDSITPPSGIKYKYEEITISETAKHLGVLQGSVKNLNALRTEENITAARKVAYALFGAGLHGKNGLNPVVTKKIWQTHILPRLTHGVEVWMLRSPQYEPMELFARNMLRQLQSMDPKTPNAAVYGLLGILPIEGETDKKVLLFFDRVTTNPSRREHTIALHQLAMKSTTDKSWFTHVQSLLHKYSLPSAHILLANPPTKPQWKRLVKHAVNKYWEDQLWREANQKPSLKYMSRNLFIVGKPSPIWAESVSTLHESRKAIPKMWMLTGTYYLQVKVAKWTKPRGDTTCKMCKLDIEDEQHFLLDCPALEQGIVVNLVACRREGPALTCSLLDGKGPG